MAPYRIAIMNEDIGNLLRYHSMDATKNKNHKKDLITNPQGKRFNCILQTNLLCHLRSSCLRYDRAMMYISTTFTA